MAGKAGTFFNPIPDNKDDNDNGDAKEDASLSLEPNNGAASAGSVEFMQETTTTSSYTFAELLAVNTIQPPNQKPFVGLGPPLNDVTKPEYDQDGYTLYADERTGERSRVFEALVEYPTEFMIKIVGPNSGTFVADMVETVAESCRVTAAQIKHSVRQNGKWTSVTVTAPVQSAQMLYDLYKQIDLDPRVKFKF